ncbi:MAG: hypothetical protein EXR12_04930 [Rhodospirillaceae bacterium]|nr:hypothetical protein [Rhodospirillaceae bacterium]
MRPGMMLAKTTALGVALAIAASPALAEPRWLACKFTDQNGAARNFHMMFDDLRGTASVFDAGQLIEGIGTSINYQSIRSRFSAFALTYNRNDGALAVSPIEGSFGGILRGECRRSPPPPGAPAG